MLGSLVDIVALFGFCSGVVYSNHDDAVCLKQGLLLRVEERTGLQLDQGLDVFQIVDGLVQIRLDSRLDRMVGVDCDS